MAELKRWPCKYNLKTFLTRCLPHGLVRPHNFKTKKYLYLLHHWTNVKYVSKSLNRGSPLKPKPLIPSRPSNPVTNTNPWLISWLIIHTNCSLSYFQVRLGRLYTKTIRTRELPHAHLETCQPYHPHIVIEQASFRLNWKLRALICLR